MGDKSFFRAFFGTAGLQLAGRGISVVAGVLFARLLNPEEFGRYSLVLSIMVIATLPVSAGLPQLLVREIAKLRVNQEQSVINGLLKWSTRYVLSISFIVTLAFFVSIKLNFWDARLSGLVLVGALLVPFKGLLARQSAVLNGYHCPERAQLPTLVFAPFVSTLTVIVVYFVVGYTFNAQRLLYVQLAAHCLAFGLSFYLLTKVLDSRGSHKEAKFRVKHWQYSLLPFTVLTIVGTMNNELATVFLGLLGSETDVGYFRVAMQAITLLALGLQAVNTVSGPRIASLYKQGKFEETQKLLTTSVRLSAASSIPFAILLILFSDVLVNLLFGHEYQSAASIIRILCVGQIVNVCMGSVGLVLNMTGNEKLTLKAQFTTLIITIILLVTLIPLFQAKGAAYAVSIGLIIWNVIMAYDVYKTTGFKPWLHIKKL